jgi:hypothetical protein
VENLDDNASLEKEDEVSQEQVLDEDEPEELNQSGEVDNDEED